METDSTTNNQSIFEKSSNLYPVDTSEDKNIQELISKNSTTNNECSMIFKIDVGNIDEENIEEYIHNISKNFKKLSEVNPNDGQINYRFNILGCDEDIYYPPKPKE